MESTLKKPPPFSSSSGGVVEGGEAAMDEVRGGVPNDSTRRGLTSTETTYGNGGRRNGNKIREKMLRRETIYVCICIYIYHDEPSSPRLNTLSSQSAL